jgi:pilus assembly protein CpaB
MTSSTARYGLVATLLVTAVGLGAVAVNSTRPVNITMAPQQLPAPLLSSYLVAAHPLPAGTLARGEDFAVQSVPATNLPSDVLADTVETRGGLRGSLIRNFIDAGQPVHLNDVLRPRDRGFIASVLRDGYRAVAVGVDPVSGVAGLIWPGDHVDLLLTQDAGDRQKTLSETVLSDVRVIAIDQEIVQGASAAGRLARTVTLEVEPNQAQRIAVASAIGKLSLAIRPAVDARSETLSATRSADVSPSLQERGTTVKIWNGKDVSEVHFQ